MKPESEQPTCDCHLHENMVCDICQNVTTLSTIKDKIRASNPKNRGKSPARANKADRIILRAKKKLAGALKFANEDVAIAMEVLREQMLNSPMPKIRQDAALAILAYEWGRPTERRITATIDADDFPKMLERFRHSPVAQEKLGDSLQSALESKENAIEAEVLPSETEPPAEENSAEK